MSCEGENSSELYATFRRCAPISSGKQSDGCATIGKCDFPACPQCASKQENVPDRCVSPRRLKLLSLGLDGDDLADFKSTQRRFDSGAIAYHHPDHVRRIEQRFGGGFNISRGERGNAAHVGIVKIQWKAELQQIAEQVADSVHRFMRAGKLENLLLLDFFELFGSARASRRACL